MFAKGISSTAFTGDIADRLFSNITGTNTADYSFLATLRALLRQRMPQNKAVRLICMELSYTKDYISSVRLSECMNWFVPYAIQHPIAAEYGLYIVHTAYADAGEKMLELIRANAGAGRRHMSGYIRRDDLHAFYARRLNALFYTDEAGNTVIFTGKLELKGYHALQMMIPKYLPSLFANAPLTEIETALLKSTGSKSAVEYETLLAELAKDLDIRSEIIRTKLAGFERAFERIRINELKHEITSHQSNYDSHIAILRDLSAQIQNCQYTLAGLECAVNENSGDSELVEYFMCNKNLTVINVIGTALEFVVHGYADVYDADAFEQYAGNHSGYMYSHINPAVTKVQMEKLYRAIFGDCIYKLRLCAAYTANMRTGLTASQHYAFPPESRTYLPNPHIQRYSCIGSYAMRFQEYMKKKDYVGAIDQAVVSAKNLNFYDSAVMSAFGEDLSYSAVQCIEKSNGTLLTPQEAINELEVGMICQDQ